jgi:hypothetical protein
MEMEFLKDKKYTPRPYLDPHSPDVPLQDHTQHHAPVGPTQHQGPARPAHRHQSSEHKDRVQRLRLLRMQTDSLFRSLENDAEANATKLKQLATTYDTASTVLCVGAEIGLLVQHALKEAVEETAKEAAKTIAKKTIAQKSVEIILDELRDEMAKQSADRQADKLLARDKTLHYLGTAVHVWANFGPAYLASIRLQTKGKSLKEIARSADRIANSRPEDLLAESQRELRLQHRQTIDRIDQEIRKAETPQKKG